MTISEPGIQLIQGASASQILYTCLAAAVEAYPEVFKAIQFPKHARDFKRQYAAVLPRFEAARINQPNRADIARLLAETFQAQLVYDWLPLSVWYTSCDCWQRPFRRSWCTKPIRGASRCKRIWQRQHTRYPLNAYPVIVSLAGNPIFIF